MIDKVYSILIVDKEPEERSKLSKIISEFLTVDVASSSTEAITKISPDAYDLVLADFETIALHIDIFLRRMGEEAPDTQLALMTPLPLEEYIFYLRKLQITNVFPKRPTYDPHQVMITIENLIEPEKAFGLRRYLNTTLKKMNIRSGEDKSYIVSKVLNYFGAHGINSARLYDVRLVLEETINNFIYHAFLDENGEEKYKPSNFIQLRDDERLKLDYGFHNDTAGFAVTDNRGVLTPARILDTLCKQYNTEGLMAQSGRGFFLSRRFTDTLIINIRRGVSTQIIALFLRNGEKEKNLRKPFYINYVE